MVRSVVHLENTFLSLFGDSGRHCPYVCCYDGMFPVLNIYIYIHTHTYFHPSLKKHCTYKYLLEQVVHMLTSFS